tara:strand:- start:2358 stop:2729 length:372 start_codon:yes stop_codon:yes gene_type:complete
MARILLIEDNPDNLDMLKRRLEKRGYEVLCETDGQQGLRVAQTGNPDLVLLDLNLPELDGWKVVETLKAADETKSIPVIAVTAFCQPGDRENALRSGCDEFTSKPVFIDDLLPKIERLLSGSQ